LFGLWGDIGFALLGVFLVGTLMKAFDVSLTNWIASLNLGPLNDVTEVGRRLSVVAFLGAAACCAAYCGPSRQGLRGDLRFGRNPPAARAAALPFMLPRAACPAFGEDPHSTSAGAGGLWSLLAEGAGQVDRRRSSCARRRGWLRSAAVPTSKRSPTALKYARAISAMIMAAGTSSSCASAVPTMRLPESQTTARRNCASEIQALDGLRRS